MSAVTEAGRRLTLKLNTLLGRRVTVVLKSGVRYEGKLSGMDLSSLTLALEAAVARDAEGREVGRWPLAIISGGSVSEILLAEETVFDAKEFADFLLKYGNFAPHMIKVYSESNVVEVSRSVRVSEDGVEGSGPLAQKVYSLYREYLRRKGVPVR